MTILVAATSMAGVIAGCGDDVDPKPCGAFPPMASPSLPAVADGVSQECVPKLTNLVVTGKTVSGMERRPRDKAPDAADRRRARRRAG